MSRSSVELTDSDHQVLEVARAGVEAGCTEALFTLGDKPELLYDRAKHEV